MTVSELFDDVGVVGGFVYGSSLLKPRSACNDIDVFIVTKTNAGLWHVRLDGRPHWSVTLSDIRTLRRDLERLALAGFVLNKFINPMRMLDASSRILGWQREAIAAVLAINLNPIAWKDEQFGIQWRKNYRSLSIKLSRPTRILSDLRLDPTTRGHWDVYRSIH